MYNDEAKKFFELYSEGNALPEEIDDYIDRWHSLYEKVPATMQPALHDFLGLTKEEYEVWVQDASTLPNILNARLEHRPLSEVMVEQMEAWAVAARGDSSSMIALKNWLSKRC